MKREKNNVATWSNSGKKADLEKASHWKRASGPKEGEGEARQWPRASLTSFKHRLMILEEKKKCFSQ